MDRLTYIMKHTLLTTLFWIMVSLNPAYSGEKGKFKIIVNPDNPAETVNRKFLADLFLKKAAFWDDGQPADPVDLPMDSSTRKAFSKEILDRPLDAVKNYWQQMIFSGRDLPPIELRSEQAVIKYVISNKNAVGYVSDGADIDTAKLLKIE